MKLSDILYSLGWQTVRPLLAVAGLFSTKLARAVRGRESASDEMRAWAEEQARAERRDGGHRDSPLVWLHGASAGELAGAAPVMAELRRRLPGLRLAVTYSSPSGEGAAARLEPDYHGFVPLDLRAHADAAVAALDPAALVYAKHDVWPNLTASATDAGVPAGLINATVRPDSGRLRLPGRPLMQAAYGALVAVGAVTEDERGRLAALGVRPEVIRVTGDASFDQAVRRLRAAEDRPLRLPPRAPGIVRLIAGSTWPEDEAFLVEAAADLRTLELVLVPHEPTEEAIERIRARTKLRLGSAPRLFSEIEASGVSSAHPGGARPGTAPPPLVVDSVGFLAELYAEGDLAYVGGALAGTGLHSVLEPAAAGLPVLFGSRHDRWEAAELVEAGAALEVDPTSIYATLVSLLDPKRRRRMGEAARDFVAAHVGAGEAAAELVRALIVTDSKTPRTTCT